MFDFFKRSKKNPKKELTALLGTYELQRFPTVVMDVLSMLRDPHTKTSDIADTIQMDMGMSIKVLRLINSAAFGLTNNVSNLHHAVTILGRSQLESMLLTYAVASSIPPSLDCMEISRFWLASARRACLAKHVAQHLHAATQADSFTAAFLQDLAVPLISTRNGSTYTSLLNEWHADQEADIVDMERTCFDYDHTSIGALVAEEWGLSNYLINAIAGHHDLSEQSSAEPAVRLVSLVRYFDDENSMERLLTTADTEFGISRNMMEEMITRSFDEAEQFSETFQ